MSRNRNYAAEYKARAERAETLKVSLATATGHGRRGELLETIKRKGQGSLAYELTQDTIRTLAKRSRFLPPEAKAALRKARAFSKANLVGNLKQDQVREGMNAVRLVKAYEDNLRATGLAQSRLGRSYDAESLTDAYDNAWLVTEEETDLYPAEGE